MCWSLFSGLPTFFCVEDTESVPMHDCIRVYGDCQRMLEENHVEVRKGNFLAEARYFSAVKQALEILVFVVVMVM